jgi:hypothetical protein
VSRIEIALKARCDWVPLAGFENGLSLLTGVGRASKRGTATCHATADVEFTLETRARYLQPLALAEMGTWVNEATSLGAMIQAH